MQHLEVRNTVHPTDTTTLLSEVVSEMIYSMVITIYVREADSRKNVHKN